MIYDLFYSGEKKLQNSIKEKFFDYLLKKTCTKKQAIEFLHKNKIFDEDKISIFISEAENSGLLDDSVYAELFAEGHLTWGNSKISYELGLRGIEKEIINDTIDKLDDESKRIKEIISNWQNLETRKIISRLQNRGFSNRSIRSVLNNKNYIEF